eukprot:7552046-Heterocapsa_arctica.AAC.1
MAAGMLKVPRRPAMPPAATASYSSWAELFATGARACGARSEVYGNTWTSRPDTCSLIAPVT